MRTILKRLSDNGTQTLGDLIIIDDSGIELFICKTLELPWKNNEQQISCIPPGTYQVEKRISEKHKSHFHILDVPDRDWILIHSANFFTDLRGCIAPGVSFFDLNKDGQLDVTSSRTIMKQLWNILPEKFEIEIQAWQLQQSLS